ncbi:MAG: trigger factor [Clostridiales bacterium]|nr:trigger factor [Clostridiales bacterium]
MSNKLEQLEHNMVKITMEIAPDVFENAINTVYNKNRGRIQLPGFRKGKAPRKMIERMYGKEVFYEDAINECLPEAYEAALKELEVEPASRPQFDVENIEDGKVTVNALVAVRPEVTLGQYKGLDVARDAVIVTEDDVDEDIRKTAERNARMVTITDRPAQMGDTVTIDFEGFVDGEAFEGGKGTDHALELGSHSFIDTFEDQLIGKNVGEHVEVNVTFPENYHAADLAGKPALFQVDVKEIKNKEIPAIDDELAKDVSEFDTLEEYKASVRTRLTESKQRQADSKYRQDVLAKVVENAEMDIPDAMIESQCEQMVQNFAQSLSQQGMSMDQYMKMTGGNMQNLYNMVRPDAEKQIKESLVLEAIAKAEGIEVTDEDIDNEVAEMAKMYGMEVEQVKNILDESGSIASVKETILNRKAYDVLANA